MRRMIPGLMLVAALLAVSGQAFAQDADSLVGKPAPSIKNPDGAWINSPGESLEALKGRVIWLEFGFMQ